MKNYALILFIFLVLPLKNLSAQTHDYTAKQYFVVRVEYALKKTGVVCRFSPETILDKNHSMFGIINTNEDGTLIFKLSDNKPGVVTNESEMLTTMAKLGWEVYHIHDIKVINDIYTEFIFVR